MQLPRAIAARIESAIDDLEAKPVGHINYEGIRDRALPLFGTLGEVWLLRSDGSFWRADSDVGVSLEVLPEELHTIALVAGTERYPWLRDLLPIRPVDAVDCSCCNGTGRLGPGNVLRCRSCMALGWHARCAFRPR
jgi:hypothetical protein